MVKTKKTKKERKANINKKMKKCNEFFNDLAMLLEKNYIVEGSSNKDLSAYLVPFGTEQEISYKGKPAKSFRISDHWNWYASLKRNPDPEYIQCYSENVPVPPERKENGKASQPQKASQVAFFGDDGVYRCVYGDCYDPIIGEWTWMESNPEEIVKQFIGKTTEDNLELIIMSKKLKEIQQCAKELKRLVEELSDQQVNFYLNSKKDKVIESSAESDCVDMAGH